MKTFLTRAIALFLLTSPSVLPAQVPQLINYQGRVGVDGVNFDGSGQFKFAFVNAAGTTTYWSNDGSSTAGSEPSAAVGIPVSKGLYSILLGDATQAHMTIVPATVFVHGDVHLRVWFSDGVKGFQQLTPDRRIGAVGYALMADSVSDGAITTAKIADGAVTAAKLAAGVGGSLDTVGNQPLDLRVNGMRGLRIVDPGDSDDTGNESDGAPNLIGGAPGNSIAAGVVGSTIAGGGATNYFGTAFANSIAADFSMVGGGYSNSIQAGSRFGFIGAGRFNSIQIEASESVINGGINNGIQANAFRSVIGGGEANTIQTGSIYSTIAGGASNAITGGYAFVAGGDGNSAGSGSFAAGHRAKATHNGSFVWADSTDTDFASTASNQFNVRAGGGARFETAGAGLTVDGVKMKAFTWQVVTNNTQLAVPNTGYLISNPTEQVTVTLPNSPEIGDVVRVTGVAAGGWKILLGNGQSAVTASLGSSSDWSPHESARSWGSVASSADGSKLVAALSYHIGNLYTSTDSGVTWVPRDSQRYFTAVASSADGSKLMSGIDGGGIYRSSDSGGTWTLGGPVGGNRIWESFASSSDGSKWVAMAHFGETFTSTDSGATWTARGSYTGCSSVASSADGTKLAAAGNGQIYTSADSGVTWTPRESSRSWRGIASSADGNKLVAVVNGGQIYTSTDSGVTWTPRESSRNWKSVSSSFDGSKIAAVVDGGQIYTSTDSGATWVATESNRGWSSVAVSADGSKKVAVVFGGQIYTKALPESLSGGSGASAELQYIGNNRFLLISHEGELAF